MENEFSRLASKVLAGEASNDEKKALKQILLENTEHSLIYNQLKEYWDAEVKLSSKRDKDAFEANLLAQLDFKPKVYSSNYRKFYLRFASAAAILFFALTSYFAYLFVANTQESYITYVTQLIPVEYTLKDGSKVTLNKNSSLTFKSDFGNKRRDVKLVGNAFFKVSKDKTRPFSVEALGTRTEVLGTSFNIKTNIEKSEVTTTLVEGSVHFTAHNCDVLLKPGEEVVYDTFSNKFSTKKTDTQLNTAWVSGRYNYVNIKFIDLITKLEKIYNIKIQISNQGIENRIISASFMKDEPIEEILNALESELGFNYNIIDSIN